MFPLKIIKLQSEFEEEQNMNNILETNLHLTHSPISIKDFNRIKKAPVLNPELWHEKKALTMLPSIS